MVSVPGVTRVLGAATLQFLPVDAPLLAAPPQAVRSAVASRTGTARAAFIFLLTSSRCLGRPARPAATILVARGAGGEGHVGCDHPEAVVAAAAADPRA